MIINCPECGHQVSDRAKTCPSCGIEIAGKIARCPQSGKIVFKEDMPNTESAPVATPPAPKKKTGTVTLIVAVIIALIIAGVGFYFFKMQESQNEQRAYQNAMKSDEPAVLQNYLDMYAQAPQAHRDSINAHLEALKQVDLDWTNALMSGSKSELEKYIQRHPNSVHIVEARLCIDSLDWVAACQADTPEAYQAYINAHYEGTHYDEARLAYEHLDAQQVKPEDKQLISTLFQNYYRALSERDEALLTSTLDNVLTSFLHKANATKTDVMQYMHKLYEEDVNKLVFTLNNDWHIDKKEEEAGQYSYSVDFSVDQKTERTDAAKERFCTYKVQAKISTDGKISELNMKKIVQ